MKRGAFAILIASICCVALIASAADERSAAERFVDARLELLNDAIDRAVEGSEKVPTFETCAELDDHLARDRERADQAFEDSTRRNGFTPEEFRRFPTEHAAELQAYLDADPDAQAEIDAAEDELALVGDDYDALIQDKRATCTGA